MKGINFEEWKALVKKNRQALNTKSNIYRTEPESLTWGGPGANKADEYLQMHTITYNVTGMDVPSDWPTEIKSGKTLSLNIVAPYGSGSTVAANVDYTYTNDVLKISNVQSDVTITVNIGEVLYENAKVGDYLYSDWTFGPTQKTGYLGRCIGLAEDNNGKSVWSGRTYSPDKIKWSTETIDTGLPNYSYNEAKTDMDGQLHTAILLTLDENKYPAVQWAHTAFENNGYLPAKGEFVKCNTGMMAVYSSNNFWTSTQESIDTVYYGLVNRANKTYTSARAVGFIQLSGKPGKPANNNGHEYVDLGLPSGTLWATMNVGATSSTEYGDYYMYGTGSKTYDSTDTPYDGTEDPLDLSKDTARVVWGGDWHMPTKAQCEELIANTTYTWITVDGVNGGLFTAQNGNSIFLPAAGLWINGGHYSVDNIGFCWCSSPNGSDSAYFLGFSDGNKSVSSNGYNNGYSIRPVVG